MPENKAGSGENVLSLMRNPGGEECLAAAMDESDNKLLRQRFLIDGQKFF